MVSALSESLSGYATAVEAAACYLLPEAGLLRVSGADRQTFLQRQTTNDVRGLAPGRALVTVLTSPTARILDVLTLFEEPDSIAALTQPGRSAETARFLRSRIFFMDKVTIADVSAEFVQLDLLGPLAGDVLRRMGFDRSPQQGELLSAQLAGAPVMAFLQPGFGFRLLASASASEALLSTLEGAGAEPLSPESHATLRVEAGQPAAGHELVEDYTPLEAGLGGAISHDKGCYTGQEVIARQITYDKVTRQLVGLRLQGTVHPGDQVRPEPDARPAGEVTSFALSPRLGPVALAVLKRPFHEPGTTIYAGEKGSGVSGTVTALPFVKF